MPFSIPFFNQTSTNPNRLPHDTHFQQQRIPHWQKTPTPRWVMIAFSMIALIFVPIGIAMVTTVEKVHQNDVRYDDQCGAPRSVNPSSPQTCEVSLTITRDMTPPIYVYYQLHNFNQNHRRYVSSYSPYQLHGDTDPDTTECGPTDSDNYWRYQNFETDSATEVEATQYPCGAVAGSFFNDTFTANLYRSSAPNAAIPLGNPTSPPESPVWDKRGISYDNDKTERYIVNEETYALAAQDRPQKTFISGTSPGPDFNVTLPRVDNDDFMVWMRNSALDTFRKLYRIIHCVPNQNQINQCSNDGNGKLYAGDVLKFTIENNFDINRFSGQKKIVVSTTSWAGGKNYFLGAAWITVGGVCLILAALFALITTLKPPSEVGADAAQSIFNVPGGGQLGLPSQRK